MKLAGHEWDQSLKWGFEGEEKAAVVNSDYL